MDKVEVVGFKRSKTGKKESDKFRYSANVPGVLYGNGINELFYVPMRLINDLVFTSKVHFIDFNLEGTHYNCIIQDVQFHPVNDMIIHVDLYQISEDKKIKMKIPVRSCGEAIGVKKGGILFQKEKRILVTALPKDMPNEILVDISNLDDGKTIRVKDLSMNKCTFNLTPEAPLFSIKPIRSESK